MTDSESTRRDLMLIAIGAGATVAVSAQAQAGGQKMSEASDHRRDWDWLVGSWNVRHRRLKERLTGAAEWEEFNGASKLWLTLNGYGTVDDNVIEIPTGTYRAMGIRAFDASTAKWGIWWLDERYPARIDPPVYGGFSNGVGMFEGDDTLRGLAIKVRFRWTGIDTTTPRWEQAFSPDGGATWEVNWRMEFSRA